MPRSPPTRRGGGATPAAGMATLGAVQVKTGSDGEIRRNCAVVYVFFDKLKGGELRAGGGRVAGGGGWREGRWRKRTRRKWSRTAYK
uniref:Uncharacterized protein n=1 Tax=Oryza rufipogon TaxID=4529 RepID=A0A0E0NA77_ORYRU